MTLNPKPAQDNLLLRRLASICFRPERSGDVVMEGERNKEFAKTMMSDLLFLT